MVPGRQGRKVIVAEGEPGLGQGQQPQLNSDTWAMHIHITHTHTHYTLHIHMHINMHMHIQTRINLNALFYVLNFCKLFCKTCVSLGHVASKINSNFHAFQIETVFPSCRPFQSEL